MKVVLWFLMMFMPLMANASSVNEEQLFHRLDSYIAQRSKFTSKGINIIKNHNTTFITI